MEFWRPGGLATAMMVVTAAVPTASRSPSSPTVPEPSCPLEVPFPIEWIGPEDPTEQHELGLWCAAVGPPLAFAPEVVAPLSGAREAASREAVSLSAPGVTGPVGPDRLVIVAWNAHVGHGDLDALIADLRAGVMTGAPVRDFVLLLQEAYRSGEEVPTPAERPEGARGADWIGSREHDRAEHSILEVARRHGLHLLYVPSMRNGEAGAGTIGSLEDRGNAILSSLPLSDLQAIELPVQRQRRVAASAVVSGSTETGEPWSLRVVSVHLDHFSAWRNFYMSFGSDRARHADFLIKALAGEDRAVVGGDFNTWFRGNSEPAVRRMREHFPAPASPPEEGTLDAPGFPLDRLVDYLFFRVPEGWEASYRRVGHRYGSDHFPLVGELRFTPAEDPSP